MKPRQYLIGRLADTEPIPAAGRSRGPHYDVAVIHGYLVRATRTERGRATPERLAYHLGRAGFEVPQVVVQQAREDLEQLQTVSRFGTAHGLTRDERIDVFLQHHADWYAQRTFYEECEDFLGTAVRLAPWTVVIMAAWAISALESTYHTTWSLSVAAQNRLARLLDSYLPEDLPGQPGTADEATQDEVREAVRTEVETDHEPQTTDPAVQEATVGHEPREPAGPSATRGVRAEVDLSREDASDQRDWP
jgi:hypothetical protein